MITLTLTEAHYQTVLDALNMNNRSCFGAGVFDP